MKKNIIFDLDGTLLDSMQEWRNLDITFLKKYNVIPPEDVHSKTRNMSIMGAAEFFISEFGINLTPEEVVQEFNDIITDKYKNDIQIKPYVYDYLDMEKRKGTKMCILTATYYSCMRHAIKRLGLSDYFEFIMTCPQTGLDKNNKDLFYMASEKLGGRVEDTAVYEDALYAIKTAKSAGYYVVGVHDLASEKDTEKIIELSDKYIRSFKELL